MGKHKDVTVASKMDEKAPKLGRVDKRRELAYKPGGIRWRNHFKFVGVLPDFRGFEKLAMKCAIKIKHFKEKRTFINIFEWLKPDEMLLTVGKACKKFYMLTWNEELLNLLTYHTFGDKKYTEIKFRIAKRLHDVATNNLPMVAGKEKERWMVETDTSDQSSDFWSSHDEEDAHIR